MNNRITSFNFNDDFVSRNKTASYLTVRLGATYSKEGFLVGVKSTHIHPKFNPESSRRAVGLLKLSTTLKYTLTIDSIPLVKPGYGMEEGTKCTIPSLLQNFSDIKAKLWSRERCISNYPKPFIFTDDALCAKISTGNVQLNQSSTSRNHTCNDVSKQICFQARCSAVVLKLVG